VAKSEEEMRQIHVRLSKKEYLLAEKLAKYLYEFKLIKRPSINEVVRYSLMYLGYVVAKQPESGIPGGDTDEE